MTEDTSPENLRKFLESDDPAMVMMGLSMAKGSSVPNDLLGEILGMYMIHDDKTIRAAAKSTFMKIAPEDAKQVVKENGMASYRKNPLPINHEDISFTNQLSILEKALSYTSVSLVGALIKALGKEHRMRHMQDWETDEEWDWVPYNAAIALGKIGDKRAVEPLIKALEDGDYNGRRGAIKAMGNIGDERAVEPLIKALEEDEEEYVRRFTVRNAAKEALRKLGHEVE